MSLKFYNTLTNHIDEFVPIKSGKVSLYTCGPTVYNYQHVGNWACYIYWDILVRILIANEYDVTRVMNITDVGHLTSDADEGDDKLEKGAKREGKTAWEIAKFYTDDFLKGIKRLNLIMPNYIARATDFIPRQLDMIRILKEKGFTYQINDGIYFDTSKFPNYADFACLDLDSQKPGARVEYNTDKRNPSDFAVWKFTPKGTIRDMEWPTPPDLVDSSMYLVDSDESQNTDNINKLPSTNYHLQIMGFPGWHIECSAIAKNFLGDTLDIHTGGIDHIPVHHTNEIAQSESANGVKFCNYWLHNNFLKSNGRKISKSLNNGYTLDEIEAKGYSMQDFRMFVLQGNYRSEGNFSFENLESAKNRLKNWRNIAVIRHQIHSTYQEDIKVNGKKSTSILAACQTIIEAVNNDLNTPDALRIIDDVFSEIIVSKLSDINRQSLVQLLETIDSLLGLKLIESTPDISDDAKQVLIERNNARIKKDWDLSDKLRKDLLDLGITIRDTSIDSIWEYN